jgi:hypothetical protein
MVQGGWQQQTGAVQGAPRLRPLGVGQKLDAAIKLTTRNFGTLLKIFALLLVPLQVVSFLTTISTLPEEYSVGGPFSDATVTGSDEEVDRFLAGQFIVLAVSAVVFVFIAPAASFRAIAGAYFGEPRGWRESVGHALRRLHSILWVAFLLILLNLVMFIVTAIGVALVGPVGLLATAAGLLWLNTVFAFAVPALLLEQVKGVSALGRSISLVTGNFWRTFAALLAALLLVFFVALVIGSLLAALTVAATDDDTVGALALTSLSDLIADLVTAPFLAALIIVAYLDLRVRKEAFDLQVLANAMGGRPATDALAAKPSPWVAPPGWGHPPPWPPVPGAGQPAQWDPPQPGWSQPQAPPPQDPGWSQPQAPPPQPGWSQPQAPPPQDPGWGQPQAPPPRQPAWAPPPPAPPPPPGRWEPPPPPDRPPAPPQRWEPPVPPDPPAPAAPDPPDRSSS